MEKEKEKEKVLDIDLLDNKWITNFEKEDKLYQDFYIDDNYFVHLHFIYIQKNMEIEKIREETFFMKTPNIISREEIIGLLKKNALVNSQKYSIFSLLKFNIHLKPEDISFFLRNPNADTKDFLKPIKHIDSITFDKTISMFQDLNTLYFIYVESTLKMGLNTKKNLTKKIYLHFLKEKEKEKATNKPNSKFKKTKRKYY